MKEEKEEKKQKRIIVLATNGQSLHTKRIDMRGVLETFFMETKKDKESELFMNFCSSQIQIWLFEYFF